MVMVPPSRPPGGMPPDGGGVARCPKCGDLVRPRLNGQYICRNCGTKFQKESEDIEPNDNDIE